MASGCGSNVPMQPRSETLSSSSSSSSSSIVFHVTNNGVSVTVGNDVADVAAVDGDSDVDDDETEDEESAASVIAITRASVASFAGAVAAQYAAHEVEMASNERGFRSSSSASKASKHAMQCSGVAILDVPLYPHAGPTGTLLGSWGMGRDGTGYKGETKGRRSSKTKKKIE